MAQNYASMITRPLVLGTRNITGNGNVTLSNAFVYNTSGLAIAYRLLAPRGWPLTDVYLYVNSLVGTVTALTVEIRGYSSSTLPANTVLATTTVAPSASGRWWKATFSSPVTLTEGTTYYIVIHNATATPASNNPSIRYLSSIVNGEQLADTFRPLNTTGGFASGTTSNANGGCCVAKLASGGSSVLIGCPYTTNNSDANNSLERGLYIPPLDEQISLMGITWAIGTGGMGTVAVRRASSAPGAAAATADEMTQTIVAAHNDLGQAIWAPITLQRGRDYRVTLRPSTNTTAPGYHEIEDASRYADVQACAIGGGAYAHCIDNGAGGWTNSVERWPRMQLLFAQTPTRPISVGRAA